jgi:hypothetical protein
LLGAHGVSFERFALSLLAVVLMGAVCQEGPITTAWVINQTGQAIDIFLVVDGDEELLASLDEPVGGSHSQEVFEGARFHPDDCSTGPLVARNRQGEEIARLEEPLCAFQVWMIEADGTSYIRP